MLVRRFYDDRLAQASYLIGCQADRRGDRHRPGARCHAVPRCRTRGTGPHHARYRDPYPRGFPLRKSRELAAATGAEIMLSGRRRRRTGSTDSPRTALHDGDVIMVGDVQAHGHAHARTHPGTPGVSRHRRGPQRRPGRARLRRLSFRRRRGTPRPSGGRLPGWPGARSPAPGSCSTRCSASTRSPTTCRSGPATAQAPRAARPSAHCRPAPLATNVAPTGRSDSQDEPAFVAAVLEGQPLAPTVFRPDETTQPRWPRYPRHTPCSGKLDRSELPRALRDGVVLDTRPRAAYAKAHLAGTLNIPLIKAFTTWAGWLLPDARDIFLVADDSKAASDAERALSSIGFDRLAGWFGADVVAAAEADGTSQQSRLRPMADAPRMQTRVRWWSTFATGTSGTLDISKARCITRWARWRPRWRTWTAPGRSRCTAKAEPGRRSRPRCSSRWGFGRSPTCPVAGGRGQTAADQRRVAA